MEVAVRAYAVPSRPPRKANFDEQSGWVDLGPSPWTLAFDTETTTDTGQALRVGGCQLRQRGRLHEEGLFYEPGSLTVAETATLLAYVAEHGLSLRTREESAEGVFLKTAWDRRGLIVGHNLPFDIARIATTERPAQSRAKSMRGGFTHTFSADERKSRVQVKRINAGAAFIRLTIPSGMNPELRNRRRGGRSTNHHGYFLDTATLGGSMLGGRRTLKQLAKLLRTPTQKADADHGQDLTPPYLDYLRTDVQVTWECWLALKERYDRYALPTPPWGIYSEASIGKAHLAKLGLTPFRTLNEWAPWVMGAVMESYYGGRCECAIRRVAVPGVYVDFTSEYPTVFVLQRLRRYLQAERVDQHDEDPTAVQALLDRVTVDDVLDPGLWPGLDALVLVAPNGDRLPTRAHYGRSVSKRRSRALNLGMPYRTGGVAQRRTLADCIASKLETGKGPRVLRVLRFGAVGEQGGLCAIEIAGNHAYRVDPTREDLIQRLVELRADVRTNQRTAKNDGDEEIATQLSAVQQALKSTGNGTAYGSPIELNPIEHRKAQTVIVYLPDGTSYECRVHRTEEPGKWFHPLIATLVAGAGRLLLATAMRLVADEGGQYAFGDTDSLFIVGTTHGGLVPCQNGPHQTADGTAAVCALSHAQVAGIVGVSRR